MNKKIFLLIFSMILIVLSLNIVTADNNTDGETIIKNNTAYVIYPNEIYIEQTPFKIKSNEEANILIETKDKGVYKICFDFEKDVSLINLNRIKKYSRFWFDDNLINKKSKNNKGDCINSVSIDGIIKLNFALNYTGKNKVKYNITLTNLKTKQVYILDPYLIGDLREEIILLEYFPFNNSIENFGGMNNYTTYNDTTISEINVGAGATTLLFHNITTNTHIKKVNISKIQAYFDGAGGVYSGIFGNVSVKYYYSDGSIQDIHDTVVFIDTGDNPAVYSTSLHLNPYAYKEVERIETYFIYDHPSQIFDLNYSEMFYEYQYDTIINTSYYNETPTYSENIKNEINESIYLNGSQYINIQDGVLSDDEYTLFAWFKYNASGINPIYDKRDSANDGFAMYVQNDILRCRHEGSMINYSNINRNVWMGAGCLYNGSHLQMWVNGSLYDSTPNNKSVDVNNNASIGSDYAKDNNFTGYIDEVFYFRGVLNNYEMGLLFGGYNVTYNIFFRDEETKELITNTTVLDVINDNYSNNYSTNTGSLLINGLPSGLINLRYSAEGYNERFYYLNVSENNTNTNLTLYLLKNTSGDEITATVYDSVNNKIEGAYIKVLRYNITSNNYLTVSMVKTNINGEAKINLMKNTEFYKFFIYYPFSNIKLETQPDYIYNDNINFQINLINPIAQDFFNTENINYNLSFNNDTKNFRYTFSTVSGSDTTSKLSLYKIKINGNELINTSSLTSSAGTILLNAPEINGTTYLAVAEVIYTDSDAFVTSQTKEYKDINPFGTMGLLLVLILTIVFAFVGFWSLSIMIILTPIPLLLGAIMGFVDISVSMAIIIEIIALIIAFMLGRSG